MEVLIFQDNHPIFINDHANPISLINGWAAEIVNAHWIWALPPPLTLIAAAVSLFSFSSARSFCFLPGWLGQLERSGGSHWSSAPAPPLRNPKLRGRKDEQEKREFGARFRSCRLHLCTLTRAARAKAIGQSQREESSRGVTGIQFQNIDVVWPDRKIMAKHHRASNCHS